MQSTLVCDALFHLKTSNLVETQKLCYNTPGLLLQSGCCHNGRRFSPRMHICAPYEGTFLEYENIPQSGTERGMRNMSDFEILSLVVMTANLIVQILIYIKKK